MSPPFNLCGLGCACFLQNKTLWVTRRTPLYPTKPFMALPSLLGRDYPLWVSFPLRDLGDGAAPLSEMLGLEWGPELTAGGWHWGLSA